MKSTTKNRILRALSSTGFSARVIAAVALAGMITSACDVHGISGPGTLVSITVTPNATLAPNGTAQMVAEGRDTEGRVIAISPTWSVVAGGGTISSTGLFTAGSALGLFANTVKATINSISGNASITVIAGPLATIVVTPSPVSMGIGTTQQFIALGKDAAGNIVQFSPTWSVVAGGGAVNGTGVFTAGTVVGTYANTVQASDQGIKGTATVTVTPGPLASITVTPNPITLNVNLTQQFTAVGKDASGNVVAITPFWSINPVIGGGAIGTVSGLFIAGTTPGTFNNTVIATSGSISGTATVIVTPGALATITVTPNPVTLVIGTTQQFTAVGKDVGGNIIAITPTWSVIAGGGSIDITTGFFTAGTLTGTYTNSVRASIGALAGFATVIVTSGPLASITVTPNPVFMQSNNTQQFIAVGRDGSGNVFLITPTWSVVNGGGNIDVNTGIFTAGAVAGFFANTVKATSGAISGTATVTVTAIAPILVSITVTPNPSIVEINGTQQFGAVGRDANGNVFPISPIWSVVNPVAGSINANTGLFTAGVVAGPYLKTIKATSGGISGTADVTVTVLPPVLDHITVTPNPAIVQIGGTQQFAATGWDVNNNSFAITPVWSVVNPVAGGINASTGLFTAGVVAGPYANTIKASVGLISGTATVTVTVLPPVLDHITVTPNPASVPINGTQQFGATGWDVNNNSFAITPVWSVVNPVAGGINAGTGFFTAGVVAGSYANTIKAAVGLISGTATVTVTPILATITVNPNPASVAINGTQQFGAVGRDGSGNIFAISPVWSVVNPAAGSIDAGTGFFTAGAVAGVYPGAVKAASGLIFGLADVTVTGAFVYVDLGKATKDGILAATAVSCATNGTINADVSIWPGNALGAPCVVSGLKTLGVSPADLEQADMKTAFDILMGKPCPAAHIIADIGGTTKTAGVYCTSGAVLGITGAVTLDGGGDNNAVFVFQSPASSMTTAGSVILQNGAHARNVYWVIGTSATLGTASAIQGNILANASISLIDNSTLVGRALAHTGAVSLTVGNTINLPPLSP
jgi:hypothetical protein